MHHTPDAAAEPVTARKFGLRDGLLILAGWLPRSRQPEAVAA